MINHTVNLATRHDKRIGVQLIEMAVVDSRRWTRSQKMHASIVSGRCARSIFECKARQPKRLRGLERRCNNSWHMTHVADASCVSSKSRTRLAAQRRCAGKKWLRL